MDHIEHCEIQRLSLLERSQINLKPIIQSEYNPYKSGHDRTPLCMPHTSCTITAMGRGLLKENLDF